VEDDLSRPLVRSTDIAVKDDEIPSFWQQFQYEHVQLFCRRCGRVGHWSLSYTFSPHKSPPFPVATPSSLNELDVEMVVVDTPSPQASDDVGLLPLPWILVRLHRLNPTNIVASLDGNPRMPPVDFLETP